MANELEQFTVSADESTWVDVLPSAVDTGYQIQNTNIAGRTVGQDDSHVIVVGDDIQVRISGVIDDLGLPFVVKTAVSLTPTIDSWIAVIPGTTSLQRSLQLWTGAVVWDAALNCLTAEIGGFTRRILNWFIQKSGYVAWHTNNPIFVIRYAPQIPGRPDIGESFSRNAFIRGRDLDGNLAYVGYGIISEEFTPPAVDGRGVTFDGKNLISNDVTTDLIYIHDGVSDTILSSFAAPSSSPQEMTFDGTNLISLDNSTDRIYIHDGISASVSSSFATSTSNPQGMTYDGTNLITGDDVAGKIYIHNGISASVSSSFNMPSTDLSSLAFDGINLFSSDPDTDTAYLHKGVSSTVQFTFKVSNVSGGMASLGSGRLVIMNYVNDRISIYGNIPWR